MKETLQEKDGRLFVVVEQANYSEPKLTRSYYPTGLRARDFERSYGEGLIGSALRETSRGSNLYYIGDTRLQVRCVDGGSTLPETTEVLDIPPPKQRGRALELKYSDGAWRKKTARGWVTA